MDSQLGETSNEPSRVSRNYTLRFRSFGCIASLLAVMIMQTGFSAAVFARDPETTLTVKVSGIDNNKPIPEKFASCITDGRGRTQESGNASPAISWTSGPAATQSYALIVVDKDVPAHLELANQPDQTIPSDSPRQDFYHWVLMDIPASVARLPEGSDGGYGMVGQGGVIGATNGQSGYHGPCPPWNDERLHHYHFQIYALDIPTLHLPKGSSGKQVEDAMIGHILAKGEVIGTFTTNPKLSM